MSWLPVLVTLSLLAVHGEGLSFTRTGRYIPNIKIAEEIDISDVTFTTPPSDTEHFASVSASKVSGSGHGRAKPRVIVPVVTYHKVSHPLPEFAGPSGDSSVNYAKRNYGVVVPSPELYRSLKGRKLKYPAKDVLQSSHQSVGPKVIVAPRVEAPPPKYRLINYPPRPVRPVYYLVGDDPVTQAVGDKDGEVTTPGKFSENVRWYNERELQFVKPSKNPYPKKYSPSSQKKYNHKVKGNDGYKSEDGKDSEDDETIASGNSDSQVIGRSSDDKASKGGDRVEFQMYGMDGPNSYKFGYDTGKGDNRHFRFEERDSEGKIRGHYGYMDNEGKMRIMKYEADPETGFHAGPVDYPPEDSN